MHDRRNPYGYATNEYWEFEAKRHGYKTSQAWLQAEELEQMKQQDGYDWDHTETYDDGY